MNITPLLLIFLVIDFKSSKSKLGEKLILLLLELKMIYGKEKLNWNKKIKKNQKHLKEVNQQQNETARRSYSSTTNATNR